MWKLHGIYVVHMRMSNNHLFFFNQSKRYTSSFVHYLDSDKENRQNPDMPHRNLDLENNERFWKF